MSNSKAIQIPFIDDMRKNSLKSAIESLLFASGEPLSLNDLANHLEEKSKLIEILIQEMMEEYDKPIRGIKIICIKEAIN
ncbi:chromosome segregation and condensation protein ScpB [Clostridium saccharobutylicum]|nr:chromosome segregation and condensation protein ScpB [Clostridium saccharobutylicum]